MLTFKRTPVIQIAALKQYFYSSKEANGTKHHYPVVSVCSTYIKVGYLTFFLLFCNEELLTLYS